METLKDKWMTALKQKPFVAELVLAFLFLFVTMLLFSQFSQFVEKREGVQFIDPILSHLKAVDLTWPLFSLIYGAILGAISLLLYYPKQLILLFEAYALMVLMRIAMMFLLPLNPPSGMILLQDPFVSFFVQGTTLTKDLFFSGHTATMFLLCLVVPEKYKQIFLVVTVLVAAGVLFQKVHYSVDVAVAPFVSFVALYWARRFFCQGLNNI